MAAWLQRLLYGEQQPVYSDIEQPKTWYNQPLDMEGRYTFLPLRDTLEGSVMNEREWALPGLLTEAVNAVTAPGRSVTAGLLEADAPNFALNMMGGGLLASKAAPTPQGGKDLGSFLFNTPTKPNPVVGTRFETEFLGGLLDKKPVNLEDYLGSSVMVMPWDSTSRNVAIKSVSDVDLPQSVITHGGHDYARDIAHQAKNIAGASGESIAKRIQDREAQAVQENLAAGGTGRILHLPITMGDYAENFSVMPTQTLLGVIERAKPNKKQFREIRDQVREFTPDGKKADFKPFKRFKGIDTEEGLQQLITGEGIDTTAGELRKAFVNRMYLKGNQEKFGFNAEDIVNAVTDLSLSGVPKGYVGNTVIGGSQGGMKLMPSNNQTYNTNFTGDYLGTLGQSIPVEQFMQRTYGRLAEEMSGKRGNLRQNVIGAMEKRKEGVSEIIDDQFLENLNRYFQSIRQ
jgi:hypothetical protein